MIGKSINVHEDCKVPCQNGFKCPYAIKNRDDETWNTFACSYPQIDLGNGRGTIELEVSTNNFFIRSYKYGTDARSNKGVSVNKRCPLMSESK